MPTVIARNNTGDSITLEDIGIQFAGAEIKDLTLFFDFIDLVESEDLKSYVSAGTISISDGTNYLSIQNGLYHLSIDSVHTDYIQDDDLDLTITDTPTAAASTITQSRMSGTYTNITYTTAGFQNDTTTVEWSASTPDRILIKKSGVYRVHWSCMMRAVTPNFITSYYRFFRNGSTIIGEESIVRTYADEIQQITLSFNINLNAGDYVTTQLRCGGTDSIDHMHSMFDIFKLEGVQGEQGPAGGSTIEIQDEGVQVSTNTSVLNFIGDGVVVTNPSLGNVNINVNNTSFNQRFVQLYNSVGGTNLNNTTPTYIPWTNQDIRDTDTFGWSSTTNNTRITILQSGWFELSYNIGVIQSANDNSGAGLNGWVRLNGTTILDRTRAYVKTIRNILSAQIQSSSVLLQLTSGDYVEVGVNRMAQTRAVNTRPNEVWINLKYIRGI